MPSASAMVSHSPRPHKIKDMTGLRFGKLLVIERVPPESIYQPSRRKRALWTCLCDCGKTTVVRSNDLRAKGVRGVKSCGCGRTGRPPKKKVVAEEEVLLKKRCCREN